jgi:hypothetical protein
VFIWAFRFEGAINTQRACKLDLKDFNGWCENHLRIPFQFLLKLGWLCFIFADTCKWATINRRLAAISKLHQLNNFDTPTQKTECLGGYGRN